MLIKLLFLPAEIPSKCILGLAFAVIFCRSQCSTSTFYSVLQHSYNMPIASDREGGLDYILDLKIDESIF